jgi:hypothetical protein
MSFCPECGTDHHAGEHGRDGKTAEVKIAEIEANRDIEVARIQRGEMRTMGELNAETDVAVAEIEAGADVAAAEATAETVAAVLDAGGETEPPPVVIEAPPAETDEEPSIEPSDGHDAGPPEEKKSSFSYWP